MKYLILSLLLMTGLIFQLNAQTTYPEGVYMSMEEIRTKSPSKQLNIEIIERTKGDIRMNGGNDYKLVSPDKSVKKRVLKKDIWAISDGTHLYINCLQHKCQTWYAQVDTEGDSLFFNGGVSPLESTSAMVLGGAIGGAAIATKRFPYALDLNSGKLSRVEEKEEK